MCSAGKWKAEEKEGFNLNLKRNMLTLCPRRDVSGDSARDKDEAISSFCPRVIQSRASRLLILLSSSEQIATCARNAKGMLPGGV